jgi:hypothetical protein
VLAREGQIGLDRGSPKGCPSVAMADAARAQPDTALFRLPQPTSPVNIFMEASRGADKLRTRAREEEKGRRGTGHVVMAVTPIFKDKNRMHKRLMCAPRNGRTHK